MTRLEALLSQVGVLSKAVGMGAYVDSQWRLAQFSLPSEVPCLCAFLPDKKSVVGMSDTCTHEQSWVQALSLD